LWGILVTREVFSFEISLRNLNRPNSGEDDDVVVDNEDNKSKATPVTGRGGP
jgi:hypothetical protein